MEIRSFRRVFDLERRIYRIDQLRLNPAGVPLRGIVYFLALVLASLAASALPLIGDVLSLAPWYMRSLALPGVLAALLGMIRIEGRPFHLAAGAIAAHGFAGRPVSGAGSSGALPARWWPPDVLMLPDGSDARMRAFSFAGPGWMQVNVEHERARRDGPTAVVGRRRATLELSSPVRAGALASPRFVVLARGASVRTSAPREA